jgi:hypothetical protein
MPLSNKSHSRRAEVVVEAWMIMENVRVSDAMLYGVLNWSSSELLASVDLLGVQ